MKISIKNSRLAIIRLALLFCFLQLISSTKTETIPPPPTTTTTEARITESLIPNTIDKIIVNNENNSISSIAMNLIPDNNNNNDQYYNHHHNYNDFSKNYSKLHSSENIIENIITDGTELFDTSTNTTAEVIVKATPLLKLIHDYLLVILLISVMFSMGCGVTIFEVKIKLNYL